MPVKPMQKWLVETPEGRLAKVAARTKSEARAAAKKTLECRRRLPIGTTLDRIA